MRAIRDRISYANVVSTLALFLVVAGGSAFAATQLAKNSVGSKQLRKGAVTKAKIRKGAVTPAKLSAAAKASMAGPAGPRGDTGATGRTGARGKTGSPGKDGDVGPRGPSDGYFQKSAAVSVPIAMLHKTIATLDVPAGSYIVFSTMRLINSEAGTSNASCRVSDSAGTVGTSANVNLEGLKDRKIVSPMLATTLSAAGSFSLQCATTSSASEVLADAGSLAAIEVAKLHD